MNISHENSYCPSCMKPRETFGICNECIERRDKKVEHSEVDVQEAIQRNIDKTIRRSMR